MKNDFNKILMLIIIVIQSLILHGQPFDESDLWICSYKVSTYESDRKLHCDTTEYFSSVLWFDSSEIHIISVTNDYQNNTIKTDSFETPYTMNDSGLISGQLEGFPINGKITDSVLLLVTGNRNNRIELAYILTSEKDYQLDSMNEARITDILNSNKWVANISGQEMIMEFRIDNKYISSGWSGEQIWELRRIHGYYFITISTLFTEPGLLLIKQIDQSALLVDLFANGTITTVQMIMKAD